MSENEQQTKSTGKAMAFAAWIAGILLLTQFFGVWEKDQVNPNRSPNSFQSNDGTQELRLSQNRWGHYVATGSINQQPVVFMLDTGATTVAVPSELADNLGLKTQGEVWINTANGAVQAYRTTIPELQIGGLTLRNVSGTITPSMPAHQEVLLGMSALKDLDIKQKDGELIISH